MDGSQSSKKMAKEKRTKPCSSCKKSKVKCIYTRTLPCERCVKNGHAYNCQFSPKLPSLKLPLIAPPPTAQTTNGIPSYNQYQNIQPAPQDVRFMLSSPFVNGQVPVMPNNNSSFGQQPGHPPPALGQPQAHHNHLNQPSDVRLQTRPMGQMNQAPINQSPINQGQVNQGQWNNQVEGRIDSLDSKLTDLVDIMKSNQRLLLENQAQYHTLSSNLEHQRRQMAAELQRRQIKSLQKKRALENEPQDIKKPRLEFPDDFRDGFLTLDNARDLFSFFDAHISQQLFGFEISKFQLDNIWESSPILVCAICTIASMHHPNENLSKKLAQLQVYLRQLCSDSFFRAKTGNEVDIFNTIVALVLCSFWLSESQMFTGLALQLAKEIQLDSPVSRKSSTNLMLGENDRIKLWYLLYVLDGQQSLTFNRQPIVNSQEYSLKNSRKILLEPKKAIKASLKPIKDSEAEQESQEVHSLFTDLRLVSQVEYNQALNEAFRGSAWDLLAPSSFGIPSKSNLELDKWMVSWTVLLSPANHGSVWSSKSTLIYYNFAKMHINSLSEKNLQVDAGDSRQMLPKWVGTLQTGRNSKRITPVQSAGTDDSSDDSEDEEFISNKGFVSEDDAAVSRSIAMNAAQTVLNLVLNDKDIHENLKYVPVHIHIMLYYAALLLLSPEMENASTAPNSEESFAKTIANLRTVRSLQRKIYQNLPTDKTFGDRIVKSLEDIFTEKSASISQKILEEPGLTQEFKENLKTQLSQLNELSSISTAVPDAYETSSSAGSSPAPEKISAWPGSHHGHP